MDGVCVSPLAQIIQIVRLDRLTSLIRPLLRGEPSRVQEG